jgi:hypothetical protein
MKVVLSETTLVIRATIVALKSHFDLVFQPLGYLHLILYSGEEER